LVVQRTMSKDGCMGEGFIDIDYETLVAAVKEIEDKGQSGICKAPCSMRFKWNICRMVGDKIQVGNHMPEFNGPFVNSGIEIETLVCDRLEWASTGIQAPMCKNCEE
jgi:hypothetical protein